MSARYNDEGPLNCCNLIRLFYDTSARTWPYEVPTPDRFTPMPHVTQKVKIHVTIVVVLHSGPTVGLYT